MPAGDRALDCAHGRPRPAGLITLHDAAPLRGRGAAHPKGLSRGNPMNSVALARRLVVDLNAAAPVWRLPDAGARRLVEAAPPDWEVQIVQSPTLSDGDGGSAPSEEVMAAVADAEAYVGYGMPVALFRSARRLRWVHSASAGVGSVLYPEMIASDVILTNSAGVHAVPIAEFVVGGVLHFLRGFDVAVRQQAAGIWDREPFDGHEATAREIGECHVVIVGTGGIGGAAAERLTGLGARCTGIRRRPELGVPPGFAAVRGMDAFEALLPQADVVVLAAPLTGSTRRVLDAERLALLPPAAIVVNVGRGALLDEDALAVRLAAGQLRGAVLDVYDQEPLPRESPLWRSSRALISPHVSGVSPGRYWERQLALILGNWGRYRVGAALQNVVDKHAGY